MELYNHQQRFLDKNPDKALMCWGTGTGKTHASLLWAKQKGGMILVICPKALKENWRRSVKAVEGLLYPEDINVMSKEEFKKLAEGMPRFDSVVVDEAHYFAGEKSQLSKSLRAYIKKYDPNLLLATATPYMSTPWNIYTLAGHLGYDWSYRGFRDRFFTDQYVGRRIVPKVRAGIEDEIAMLVQGLGDVVKLEECVDVPDQVFETEYFEVTKEQKKKVLLAYDPNPIVRFTMAHQIESGTLKSDGIREDQVFTCDKDEYIKEVCESEKKVAVVCRYNLQIDKLAEYLKGLGKPVYVIRGDVKDRDTVVREADSADEAIVLIQADCSEGYELPSFGVVLFASLSFSYKNYKQMLGRFLRINKLKKNVFIHLVTKDGVDEGVFNAVLRKQDFDIAIYASRLEIL